MWHGNSTQSLKDEAERIHNRMKQEERQERIAGWIAEAAIKRAKQQAAFRKATLGEKGVANRSSL